jgi:uncharacterized damage-inducible protein DinB
VGQGTLTRAEELAAQFEAVNDAIIASIAGTSAEHWQRVTASERWPVGVVAHHMLEVQRFFAGVLAGLSSDEVPLATLTSQFVDANNARHAREFAGVGKQETVDALQESGTNLTGLIRELDEQQLGRVAISFDEQPLTAEQLIQFALIGHFQEHLESIRTTLAES